MAARKVLKPAPFIVYKHESEILDYSKKITKKVTKQFKFPISIDIQSKPQIYSINAIYPENKLLPIFVYISKKDIAKQKIVNDEAREIASELTRLMPGLKKNHEFLIFRAYKEPPVDPKKKYGYMGAVVKTNDI